MGLIINREMVLKSAAFVLLLLLLHRTSAHAAIEPYQHQLRGQIKKGDTLVVKDEKFRNPAYDWKTIQNRAVSNIITFTLFSDTTIALPKSFTCEIDLKVEYWSQPGQQEPIVLEHVPLKINYDSATGAIYQAQAVYNFRNGHRVKITVNDISSKELGSAIPAIFQLTGQVIVDRQYTIPEGARLVPYVFTVAGNGNVNAASDVVALAFPQTPNQVSINWDKVVGAEEYDLEWTFIDETSDNGRILAQSGTSTTPEVLAKMFRNNATRVSIPQESYTISLVHNAQYLLVRLRYAKYTGDFREEFPWGYQINNGGTVESGVITLTNPWHLPNLNWQYNVAYAEEGKKKEVVSYFDGTLRSRQAVTVNNSDQKALVQESIYDEFGRATASILPAPVNAFALTYYASQSLNLQGSAYTFKNVYGAAGASCIGLPDAMLNTAGAARYYSTNNDFKAATNFNPYIPDAEGFPLAVTRYTPDNTGRVSVQGGVGAVLQPDADPAKNKAIRYYYGKPEQWELDKLFGNDAGYARHYLKNMVLGPNGQIAVSYQNESGKTIATALTGLPPGNVQPLATVQVKTIETIPILEPESFVFEPSLLKLTASTTYLASVTGTASFSYNVEKLIKRYAVNNVTICSNCYYELKINIYDDCRNLVYQTAQPVKIGSITADCNAGGVQTGSFSAAFGKIGEYYITFELGLSPDVIEAYTTDFVARNTNLKTAFQFILEQLKATDFTACFGDCQTCQQSLGARATFIQKLKDRLTADSVNVTQHAATINAWADGLYTALYNNCQTLRQSCMASPCERYEKMMMEDVSPAGQYALFDAQYQPLEKEINVLYQHWRKVFPVQPPGAAGYEAEKFQLEDGSYTSPYAAEFTLQLLVSYWNPAWARKFLPYHPEKCGLDFCNAYSTYIQWDDRAKILVEKAADIPIIQAGLQYQPTVPAWLMAADPFWAAGASGNTYATDFRADLESYSRRILNVTDTRLSVKGVTQFVDYMLYCADPDGNVNTNTTNNAWNGCTPDASCRIADRQWQLYRDIYFELKEKYYRLAKSNGACKDKCKVGQPVVVWNNGCATISSFTFNRNEGAGCSAGLQPVKIVHEGGAVSRQTTISIFYPAEYAGMTQVASVVYAAGESAKDICIDARIALTAIRVSQVACVPVTVDPNACNGTAGTLTLSSNGKQLSGSRFEDTNNSTAYITTYHMVPGTADAPPDNYSYCTDGTATTQYFNCYKVLLPGTTSAIRYTNIWVISCVRDICDNLPAFNMEMQMSSNKFYANGKYYYFNGEPECASPETLGTWPCRKVIVAGNSTPIRFLNVTVKECNTCDVGQNSLVYSNQNDEVYTAGPSKYIIYENTLPDNELTSDACASPEKSWYPCLKMIDVQTGGTVVLNNATVFYCYADCESGPHYLVNDKLEDSVYLIGTEIVYVQSYIKPYTCPVGYNPGGNYEGALECVYFHVGGEIEVYQNVYLRSCRSGAARVAPASAMSAQLQQMRSGLPKGESLKQDYYDNQVYLVKKATRSQTPPKGKFDAKAAFPARKQFAAWEFKEHFALRTGEQQYEQLTNVWVARRLADPVTSAITSKNESLAKSKPITKNVALAAATPVTDCNQVLISDFSVDRYPDLEDANYAVYKLGYLYSEQKPLSSGISIDVQLQIQNASNNIYYEYHTFNSDNQDELRTISIFKNEGWSDPSIQIIMVRCTPTIPTCPPGYASKQPRFEDIPVDQPFTGNVDQLQAAAMEQLNTQISTACTAMADTWLQQLDACLASNTAYQAKRDLLRQQLIAVCKLGGDQDHPFGASTSLPGKATTEGYTSFTQVVKLVLGLTNFDMLCNPWMIDAPYPYKVKAQTATQVIAAVNAGLCAKLTALQQEHQAIQPGLSFYQYLSDKYGEAMNITDAALSQLLKGCNNCRYLLEQEMTLPVFLDPGAVGCVTPQEFQDAITALGQEGWTTLDAAHANYETVLRNYLNQLWGFTLGYVDYKTYQDKLAANPATGEVLCNTPVYRNTEADPYACMLEMVDNAVMAGQREYDVYIDSVKQDFRKQYVSVCAANKAKATMTAEQQIYHYTLYYYDQAGNLVRTVPPEGVELLTAAELSRVQQARAQSGVACTYNGPVANTDKTIALQKLSDAILGNNRATEMWVYNETPGAAQVLATTDNKGHIFNMCIDGRYIHIEIYTLEADGTGGVNIISSNEVVADMNAILPLKPWTHVVLNTDNMGTNPFSVFVNGVLCPAVTNAPLPNCSWEISATPTGIVYPEHLANLKHLRLYTRLMTTAEIAANAQEACLAINATNYPNLSPALQLWGRFNTPDPGTVTTLPDGNTTETQYSRTIPKHRLTTTYAYNSLNQVVQQRTPDAGDGYFWYDRLGRLLASQNAAQVPATGSTTNRYSYTIYDPIGRIKEVGEKTTSTAALPAAGFIDAGPANTFLAAGTNAQLTRTVYDVPVTGTGGVPLFLQEHLRKRVAAATYQESAAAGPEQATYYSYDLQGNVKTLWQQLSGLGTRKIDYQYDLVSGKVNKVRYQQGAADQFYYGYEYDAENRLIKAQSGIASTTDAWAIDNPVTDAYYRYYLHGPLARVELGKNTVQGMDYAYTLQGWLKGINGHYLQPAAEIGKDGHTGAGLPIGQDVLGFSLDYFKGDYKPIGGSSAAAFPLNWQSQGTDITGQDLFNGNISRSTLALNKFRSGIPIGYTYRYDQLNRLVKMRQHNLTAGATTWSSTQLVDAYGEDVSYDGNGNILTYLRNGENANGRPLQMDQLSYHYPRNAAGQLTANRLQHIKDAIGAANYTEDIDNQADNNYLYDNLGNLIKDVQAGITQIQWTVYGKIKSITRADGSSLAYRYDAAGNRIYKQHTVGSTTNKTWYLRDAEGNPLALYGNKNGDAQTYWQEQHLYGSSRLGMWQPDMNLQGGSSSTTWGQEGNKRYELSNHLGNVLATITDKKIGKDTNGDGTIDYYEADVANEQDYYPFGMLQPGRNFDAVSGGNYRYGFNGKENDNEVKGEGNQQDYGMRIYDPRAGKFLSVDPLASEYPWTATYSYAENNPVNYEDVDGLQTPATRPVARPRATRPALSNTFADRNGNLVNGRPSIGPNSPPLTGPYQSTYRVQGGWYVETPNGGFTMWDTPEKTPKIDVRTPEEKQLEQAVEEARALFYYFKRDINMEKPTPMEKPKMPPLPVAKTESDEEQNDDIYLYRGGSFTDGNFTPKQDDTIEGPKQGWSTFVDPKLIPGKPEKYQVLSKKKLVKLGFGLNVTADGHVGIVPKSQRALKIWAATKEDVKAGKRPAHLLTKILKKAWVKEGNNKK